MIKNLSEWMLELGICEEEIVEKFILGTGSGGQKINKSSSCVYLRHKPTGIEIKCQKSRSRESNRLLARQILCQKVAQLQKKTEELSKKALFKIQSQKRKRSKAQKEKIAHEKRKVSLKKKLRQKTFSDGV